MPAGDEMRTDPEAPAAPGEERRPWELRLRDALLDAALAAQARRVCTRRRAAS